MNLFESKEEFAFGALTAEVTKTIEFSFDNYVKDKWSSIAKSYPDESNEFYSSLSRISKLSFASVEDELFYRVGNEVDIMSLRGAIKSVLIEADRYKGTDNLFLKALRGLLDEVLTDIDKALKHRY